MPSSRIVSAAVDDGITGQAMEVNYLHRANGSGRAHRLSVDVNLEPSKRYILPKGRSYASQYAKVYFCRLQQLRGAVETQARANFGPASPTLRYAKSIVDASDETIKSEAKDTNKKNVEIKSELQTVIVGIVFREMKGKPSILAMYEQPSAHSLIPDPPERARQPFGAAGDKVFLEDDQVRCALDLSALDAQTAESLVTGLVIAVRGREDRATGAFAVSGIAHVGAAPLPSFSKTGMKVSSKTENGNETGIRNGVDEDEDNEDGKAVVCLVSTPVGATAELLLEDLRGTMEDDEDDDGDENEFTKSIVQLIIAGNVVEKPPPPSHTSGLGNTTAAVNAAVQPDFKDQQAKVLRDADAWLSAVSATLPVSVMPGPEDATNSLLPQQPLHRCLLPGASRNNNLKRVPNPFACSLSNKLFLGTSGQNVDDIALYDMSDATEEPPMSSQMTNQEEVNVEIHQAEGEKVLDILEMMIMNRHIAPTCPDTLGCFPFTEIDPFVLEASPHVFFVGNQRQFATRLVKIDADATSSDALKNVDAMDIAQDGVDSDGTYIRLISVPRFNETGQAVFINVDNLEVSVREYGLGM